jgi:enterochelin esterase-like enzyme
VTKEGSVHVARATPNGYEELAKAQVFDELTWTPPSFAGGSLFVRSLGSIARLEIGKNTTSTSIEPNRRDGELGRDRGSRFERFLVEVRAASDKSASVDAFLEEQTSFPIVDGDTTVHFVYRGQAEDVAIGGDMIGGRQEKAMSRVEGTNLFYYSTELQRDARVSYLFIKDFKDALIDPLNPSTAQWALIGEDMSVDAGGGNGREPIQVSSLAMPGWSQPSHLAPLSPGAPRGRLVRHELESAAIGQRHTFDVYLPHGYDEGGRRYPVVYYHGGTNAVKLGRLTNALDALIGNELEPMVVVFMDITGGNIFMPRERYGELWANELVPFMDETYRTLATREGRANVGAGTSAHDAAHCAFAYPALSSKLAIQSLGVVDIGRNRLEPLVMTAQEHPLQVHIEWGVYDLYNPHEVMDVGAETRRFVEFLVSRGYAVESVEVADGTGWPAWRNRTDAMLGSLFPLTEVERAR